MFAVIIHDAIYGIGETEAEAMRDAEEWADNLADAKVMPCTERLAQMVVNFGGAVEFDTDEGIAMTPNESAALNDARMKHGIPN